MTDIHTGLTAREAARRMAAGQGNANPNPRTRSVGEILRSNLLTPFNLLNLVLAALVILVGSWKNLLFMGVILCNIAIGIFQELRAKAAVDKLSLIAAPRAKVRRDGEVRELPLEELVLDDVVLLSAGDQVGADCVVAEGTCRMNEALLTGETEPVERGEGDTLLSGSFLAGGRCVARVIHVGADNYAARITAAAKAWKRPNSEILNSVNAIIRVISLVLAPLGIALFLRQWFLVSSTPRQAVVSTVAALVGMIPEGLVLLTSVVLAVSVLRLVKRQALTQDLYSIEMLARVDVLCTDKTGTLTTGSLKVEELRPMRASAEEAREGLAALLAAAGDDNATAQALRAFAGEDPGWEVKKAAPFRSERKWSGGAFANGQVWCMGAAQFLFPNGLEGAEELEELAARGLRVVLVARGTGELEGDALPGDLTPAAALVLSDELRPGVEDTLAYFESQGVALKVISGDDPRTVSAVARLAGMKGAESWVDASALETEEEVRAAAEKYAVFGRVTPQQKLWLLQGLKAGGHTVAMTGDGVNDVLALRESDCSVAMAAGSEAARNVSQIVLLNSDFSTLPHIVDEGRRSINNLQRSSALFLTKTCFATLMAVCFLVLAVGYPFQPIQLTLISSLTIGAPSFLLALEPNFDRVRGSFRDNVARRAVPGGAAMATVVLWCVALLRWFSMEPAELSTLCVLGVGISGLINLFFVSRPLNGRRWAILALMTAGFCLMAWLMGDFFSLTPLRGWMWPVLGLLSLWSLGVQGGLRRLLRERPALEKGKGT